MDEHRCTGQFRAPAISHPVVKLVSILGKVKIGFQQRREEGLFLGLCTVEVGDN